jgi:hypothetical protein
VCLQVLYCCRFTEIQRGTLRVAATAPGRVFKWPLKDPEICDPEIYVDQIHVLCNCETLKFMCIISFSCSKKDVNYLNLCCISHSV